MQEDGNFCALQRKHNLRNELHARRIQSFNPGHEEIGTPASIERFAVLFGMAARGSAVVSMFDLVWLVCLNKGHQRMREGSAVATSPSGFG